MFNEGKVVGFSNELRKKQNDLSFDVTFGDETEAEGNKMIVTKKKKVQVLEIKVKSELYEESSSSSETEN